MSENVIIELISHISYVLVVIAIVFGCVYISTLLIKEYRLLRRERKEYIESLCNRDKAVIGKYIAYTKE